jgi:alanine dehydrogenase
MYRILTDDDLKQALDMPAVVACIEQAIAARAEGALVAPPRFAVEAGEGGLVFTAGAETRYAKVVGFRVYDTYPDDSHDHEQLVAVFDSQTGALRGVLIGRLAGALRTAAINAVAIRHMARQGAQVLGVLGAGFQAGYHLQAAAAVRPFTRVLVYSRSAGRRQAFAAHWAAQTGLPVQALDAAEAVVRQADVLICATNSTTPVLDAAWVRPGTHVNTIGPKFAGASETPPELAQRSRVIACDSPQQAAAYGRPFFLSGTPEWERMVDLSEIVTGRRPGRHSEQDITLFCSVGLAGTEVALAAAALQVTTDR